MQIRIADITRQVNQTKTNEGFRSTPYQDDGKDMAWTVGYGHNITANPFDETMCRMLLVHFQHSTILLGTGQVSLLLTRDLFTRPITETEADDLLRYDMDMIQVDMERTFPIFSEILEEWPVRGCALFEMGFQMGPGRLSKFRNMWGHIDTAVRTRGEAHWTLAAKEGMDSLWGRRYRTRALEVTRRLETNTW